ncbi:MAG: phosphoribosylformylglycinamidine synthase subunit PurQ [Clostridia bacterium]|nr:phosphoribosylformylglycinamidine synthase subunit PurQ [Clostridia bacterium]
MQKRFFLEKKTEYADEARRIYRFLTERMQLHSITGVRKLRCLLLDGWEPYMEKLLTKELYMNQRTEDIVEESAFAAASAAENTVCVSWVPLFCQPAEALEETALRCALSGSVGRERSVPALRQAEVLLVSGISEAEHGNALRRVFINPASSAPIDLLHPGGTLPPMTSYDESTELVLRGFCRMEPDALVSFALEAGFHMSEDDLRFVQSYYSVGEKRDPTLLELRMIDTYWSDHCRHITFLTALQDLEIEDPDISASFENYLAVRESLYGTRPKNITLMDMATLPARYFRREEKLPLSAETGEKNAFTIRVPVRMTDPTAPGEQLAEEYTPYLLHFKNETHNFPTQKEPYLGAASSFGATVCDPLSARGTVIVSMRLSASADPAAPLPPDSPDVSGYRICRESADGFAAFGAQCGVPVGLTREWIHPGFSTRHMEICMTAAAVPEANWHSGRAVPGDIILLVGAPTGKDGMGGTLTASSLHSHETAAEDSMYRSFARPGYTAQVVNPQTERALLRLMRRTDVMRLIKRGNDVGAGGLGVAAGELAEGVRIDLDKVPTVLDRFDGSRLSPWETAASETLGRLVLVAASIHAPALQAAAAEEGLSMQIIGVVTAERRFRMMWHDRTVLNLSRDFLDSTGAERRIRAYIPAAHTLSLYTGITDTGAGEDITSLYIRTLMQPEVCSQKPLSSRFDHTVGGRTAFLPFGGRGTMTPLDFTAVRMPVEAPLQTETCAVFSYGCLPAATEKSPYHGAYLSVLQAICRMAAAGIPRSSVTLSLQECFPAVNGDPVRFGVPLAAMLGAFQAQMDYSVAAVGGKDSMSGSNENGDIPPTVIAFSAAAAEQNTLCTSEFKKSGSRVYLLAPSMDDNALPDPADECGLLDYLAMLHADHKILACAAVGAGGCAAAVAQMCFGNHIGFNYELPTGGLAIFEELHGAFLVETDEVLRGTLLGYTKDTANIFINNRILPLELLQDAWMKPQQKIYRQPSGTEEATIVAGFPYRAQSYSAPSVVIPEPKVLLPVFPGISDEDAMAARFEAQGLETRRFVFRGRSAEEWRCAVNAFSDAIGESQILAFSGGCCPSSGGMPDPAAACIRALFADPLLSEALGRFREDDSRLMLGAGTGFSFLLAMGAFAGDPFIGGTDGLSLAENPSGRLTAQTVRVKIMSVSSPWMRYSSVGDILLLPVSSGAGRCLLPGETVLHLAENGQIAAQYADADGNPTMAAAWNPFASEYAVEGIFSRDGRVYGRMAHCERADNTLFANVPGNKEHEIFRAAADYYKVH